MSRHRIFLGIALLLVFWQSSFAEVKVSKNVNVVANEPIPQKQLEVDAQASPANPDHLFSGYINYQTGTESSLDPRVTARARCGFSFSTNGGKTWKTSALNALDVQHPILDGILPTAAPSATVLKCGDPAITIDNMGNIYYFFLTELTDGQTTMMSVAKFTDPNDGSGIITYRGQVLVDSGQAKGKVLDKGYIMWVPDPANPDATAPGFIYVCYGNFDGKQYVKIVCAISKDRGATFSRPNQTKLNGTIGSGNGTALAPGPNGTAYLVFFAADPREENYYFVKVKPDGTAAGNLIPILPPGYFPYEAPTRRDLARVDPFATIVSDGKDWVGVFFSAYSKDGHTYPPTDASSPHIFASYSSNGGLTWTPTPQVIDPGPKGRENLAHQFLPRATYAGGIVSVFYYDARNDGCWDAEPNPSSCGRELILDKPTGEYFPSGRDRRFDTFVVQGRVNGGMVDFTPLLPPPYYRPATQVSRYDVHGIPDQIQQRNVSPGCDSRYKDNVCIGVNLFNLPATSINGGSGFGGDYIAHAAKSLWYRNPPGGSAAWRYTNDGDSTTTLAWWTDFRRVALPLKNGIPDLEGDWTLFVAAGNANCVNPLIKNTDIEFAEITESGLSASVKGSALRTGIQPDFTVTVWNRRGFDLLSGNPVTTFVRLTIEDSVDEDWSFEQTSPPPDTHNSVDAKILNGSSVTLGVFYQWLSPGIKLTPTRSVRIKVEEISGIGGSVGGLTTSATYNVFTPLGTVADPHKLTLSSKPKISTFTSLTSSTSHSGFDDLGFDDLGFDDLGFDDLGFDDLGFTTLSDSTSTVPLQTDKQVMFTVTGDGGTSTVGQSFTSVANGQELLSNNWKFWVGVVATQWNTNVNQCTLIRTPTDVVLSSIPITQAGTQNFQVSYDDLGFDDLGFDDLGFSTISEQFEDATFSLDKGEKVKVVLRAFRPTGSTLVFLEDNNPVQNEAQIGEAVFGTDDSTLTEQFFDTTPPIILPIFTEIPGTTVIKPHLGWFRTSVGLDWSVKDAQSGILSHSASCGNPAISDPEPFTAETAGIERSCSAVNRATDPTVDHTSQESITIKIDMTKPNPPIATVTPAPNPQGWNNRLPVTVTFTCNGDPGAVQSGIDNWTAPVTFTNNTDGTTVNGTCTDVAGNVSDPTPVLVKIR